MFSYIDYAKNAIIVILIAAIGFLYYNQKSLKTDVNILISEKEKLLLINKQSQDTIDKLHKDAEKQVVVVTQNNKKQEVIRSKKIEQIKEIEKISEVKDDKEYEKLINEKYQEIMKCLGSC